MSWNALTTTILYSYSLIPCQKFYYNSGNIKTETRVLAAWNNHRGYQSQAASWHQHKTEVSNYTILIDTPLLWKIVIFTQF